MHGFTGPTDRLVDAPVAGRRSGLYLRRPCYVQHVVHFAGGLPFHAVDRIEGDTAIVALVRPHDILETEASTAAPVLHVVLHGLRRTAAKMHPAILSGWIGFKLGALERFHRGTEQRCFFYIREGIVRAISVKSLQLRFVCKKYAFLLVLNCRLYHGIHIHAHCNKKVER